MNKINCLLLFNILTFQAKTVYCSNNELSFTATPSHWMERLSQKGNLWCEFLIVINETLAGGINKTTENDLEYLRKIFNHFPEEEASAMAFYALKKFYKEGACIKNLSTDAAVRFTSLLLHTASIKHKDDSLVTKLTTEFNAKIERPLPKNNLGDKDLIITLVKQGSHGDAFMLARDMLFVFTPENQAKVALDIIEQVYGYIHLNSSSSPESLKLAGMLLKTANRKYKNDFQVVKLTSEYKALMANRPDQNEYFLVE